MMLGDWRRTSLEAIFRKEEPQHKKNVRRPLMRAKLQKAA
jgi:hypothetical protein